MRALTLVVNCTDRKSVRPDVKCQVRSLPSGSVDERHDEWTRRIRRGHPVTPLRHLYRGEAWLQALGLAADATDRGFRVRMMVASAGLGLRHVDSLAPSYSATFTGGQADSVASGTPHVRSWWSRLGNSEHSESLVESSDRRVLLVLSESYARAMHEDLVALGRRRGEVVMIGGAEDVEGLHRVRSDRALRAELGGTGSSLNLRIARAWLGQQDDGVLWDADAQHRWTKWCNSVRREERYNRTPGEDAEIVSAIEKLVALDQTLSATRALRIFRDSGMACEQKRFGRLFRSVKVGMHE